VTGQTGPIYFWQRIVSPHMAGLAAALAGQECAVVYVAERQMSEERAQQGWTSPGLGTASLELAPTAAAVRTLALSAPVDAVHICQGIRSNGLVGVAQRTLAAHHRKQWVVMETVEDAGWRGVLKRLEYRRLFLLWRNRLQGYWPPGTAHQPGWCDAGCLPNGSSLLPISCLMLLGRRANAWSSLPDRSALSLPGSLLNGNGSTCLFRRLPSSSGTMSNWLWQVQARWSESYNRAPRKPGRGMCAGWGDYPSMKCRRRWPVSIAWYCPAGTTGGVRSCPRP